jgi:hypothetical protein
MTDELNRAFDDSGGMPFRPFVIEEDDGHFVGIIYHHWVADSFSIRMLLREWFLRLHEPVAARREPFRIADKGYWRHFGPGPANWELDSVILNMFRWNARFRRARRIGPDGLKDLSTHFSLHRAPDGLIERIAHAARRCGVTVNDIFTAAMARVCDQLVPVKRTERHPDLALGTVVDLRSRAKGLDNSFGLFLGITNVFVGPKDLRDDRRLLRQINEQSAHQKASAEAESCMVRMVAGLVLRRMLKPESLLEFYRKRAAAAAGISNVNLTRDWPARDHPSPLLEYVRVSPVGPLVPVVFTPTTLGGRLNFGLTCRESVVPRCQAPALAALFLSQLRQFADARPLPGG